MVATIFNFYKIYRNEAPSISVIVKIMKKLDKWNVTLTLIASTVSRYMESRCIVEYDPKNGRRQNVHTKSWIEVEEKKERIVNAKQIKNANNINQRIAQINAKEKIKEAEKKDKVITKALKSISQNIGSKMAGLENRIKSKESLVRKILKDSEERGLSIEKTSRMINDVLRYTVLNKEDDFTNKYFMFVEKMEEKGYNINRIKNTFIDGVPYKGVNTLASLDGYIFELQFHTAKSLEVKEGILHKLYEEQRVLDKTKDAVKWQELTQEMIKHSGVIPNPPDVERIK